MPHILLTPLPIHLLPQLPIPPLHILQPLLLHLRPRQIIRLQINNILPVVGIGIQRKLLIFDDAWDAGFDVVELLAVDDDAVGPEAGDF